MDSEWRPGNEVESEMLAALESGAGGRFAEILRSSPLYMPTLVDGSPADWPDGLPRFDAEHVLVFTSPVTLYRSLAGYARGYEELTFEAIQQRWPDPGCHLLVNPGAPIGVMLTMRQVTDLAEGEEDLVPVEDVQDAVVDGLIGEVRRQCLAELGGDEDTAARVLAEVAPNDLEKRLEQAVLDTDFDAFLLALLNSEIIVLTTRAVADPGQIMEPGFPWRVLGDEETPVIPVFSSTALLDQVSPEGPHRIQTSFLDLLAAWPSDEHILCFNPGTTTELVLPGGGVPELAAAVAEASSE